jgi:hypothetical protein
MAVLKYQDGKVIEFETGATNIPKWKSNKSRA